MIIDGIVKKYPSACNGISTTGVGSGEKIIYGGLGIKKAPNSFSYFPIAWSVVLANLMLLLELLYSVKNLASQSCYKCTSLKGRFPNFFQVILLPF